MSQEVFEASIKLLKVLVDRGTQKELNLNGNGESLLDSRLLTRIARLRCELGKDIILQFSTNGILLNPSMAASLKKTGINRVDLSAHNPAAARKARCYFIAAKMNGIVTNGPVSGAHNWAGQLEPENSVPILPVGLPCDPLIEGRAYIQSEGDIVPCCYDYRNLGKFTHVFDGQALEREMKPFLLCESCHQVIPKNATTQSEYSTQIANCAS
jgi:hypothetical protein